MAILNPQLKNLLEKLMMAEAIYRKVALDVDQDLQQQFAVMADRKRMFSDDIIKLVASDLERQDVEQQSEQRLRQRELELQIKEMLLDLDQSAVIQFCIDREDELRSMYYGVIKTRTFDQFLTELFEYQMAETNRVIHELEKSQQMAEVSDHHQR